MKYLIVLFSLLFISTAVHAGLLELEKDDCIECCDKAPTNRIIDSTGAQVGDFEENGNVVFLRDLGKRIVILVSENGFAPGYWSETPGSNSPIFFSGAGCTGDAIFIAGNASNSLRDQMYVYVGLKSKDLYVTSTSNGRVFVAIPEQITLTYNSVLRTNGTCGTLAVVTMVGFKVEEVTNLLTGFTPPFSRVPF